MILVTEFRVLDYLAALQRLSQSSEDICDGR
jgi:hypothetical protein